MIDEIFKEVLLKESDAIFRIQSFIDSSHEKIINLLADCKGKLVFMGVGKSGHIGKKLAATFASLGIPAFFVHSTEAMHGDLGMVESRDIAILISNSGNTEEVIQNVQPLSKNGVVTIAFTSGKNSRLADECDYVLLYPKLPEADELGFAPTVSSTVTLALGDAIVCAISGKRGFTKEDFYKYHPNGTLGAALKKQVKGE